MTEWEVIGALLWSALTWIIGYVMGYVDKGRE